jgi:hypothetical protein
MDSNLTPQQVQEAEQRALAEKYPMRVLCGLDHLVNTFLGGKPDETISARAARDAAQGKKLGEVVSFLLSKVQKNHPELAEAGDLVKAQDVASMETQALAMELEGILHMPEGEQREAALGAFAAKLERP